jgi:ABC-2 type transport system permease protein
MKIINDSLLMFKRSIKHALRDPIWVFLNLFQPLLYLFLFMPLLEGLGDVPGLPKGKTVQEFIPGLLVMLAMFGSAFVGFGLVDEIRTGVIDRFLVTPVHRAAIMLGRVLKDVVILLCQCIIVTIISIPFGLVLDIGGFAISLLLYAFIAISMSSMSYGFALLYKSEDTLSSTLNTIALPVSLLSGIMLPLALAPLDTGARKRKPLLLRGQRLARAFCREYRESGCMDRFRHHHCARRTYILVGGALSQKDGGLSFIKVL